LFKPSEVDDLKTKKKTTTTKNDNEIEMGKIYLSKNFLKELFV
jgi:hypothetical protein